MTNKCRREFEELVDFIRDITDALGKYPHLDGTPIVADARKALAKWEGKCD